MLRRASINAAAAMAARSCGAPAANPITRAQAAGLSSSSSASSADDDNAAAPPPPGAAWLRSLVDHERQGVPDGAGDPSSARKFDLTAMRGLLAGMGDPQDTIPRITHIAGTKGKGSVAAMLSAVLRAGGLRVGTYSSPHLLSASERAVVGGGGGDAAVPMPDAQAERLALLAAKAAGAGSSSSGDQSSSPTDRPLRVSHFEATTAMALRWFADARVGAAVVECGVGGETDATNVFSPSSLAAAVLTPVGHDHLAALGGSVAAAARAKAGILKRGRPAVIGAQPNAEARDALREAVCRSGARPAVFLGLGAAWGGAAAAAPPAAALDIRVEAAGPVELRPPDLAAQLSSKSPRPKFEHLASQPVRVVVGVGGGRGDAGVAPPPDLSAHSLGLLRELEASTRNAPIRMRLVGQHQRANAATAIAAAALMAAGGEPSGAADDDARPLLDAAAVARGLGEAFLPGRFQVLGLPPAGPEATAASAGERRRYLILDCAHTPESAEALARTTRAALASSAGTSPSSDADAPPVVLVLAMAEDKPHRDVAAQLLYRLRPRAVIFTSVPIAGGRARAASPTTLAAQWQAAAMLPAPPSTMIPSGEESDGEDRPLGSRPPRCREIIQASLKAALQKARRELEMALAIGAAEGGSGGGSGSGVGAIVVAGSNHAVAAALRDLGVEDIVEQLE